VRFIVLKILALQMSITRWGKKSIFKCTEIL
jgi:hypothetical protein